MIETVTVALNIKRSASLDARNVKRSGETTHNVTRSMTQSARNIKRSLTVVLER